jgi:sigma-B regulation protein RsbU (phosphoserine phosphatase)
VWLPWPRKEQLLCLFTDGVAEAVGEHGDRFGEGRVLGHVARLKDRPAREILEAVDAELAGFTGGAPPSDDRTLVILRV